jgi:hypothetical protein
LYLPFLASYSAKHVIVVGGGAKLAGDGFQLFANSAMEWTDAWPRVSTEEV